MVEGDAAAAAMNAIAAARPVDSAVAFETEAAEVMYSCKNVYALDRVSFHAVMACLCFRGSYKWC